MTVEEEKEHRFALVETKPIILKGRAMRCEYILYVRHQEASKNFYRQVLAKEPFLDVPGMTSFYLAENCILGLMPESGIMRLLSDTIPDVSLAQGIPRCEVYMHTGQETDEYMQRAMEAGATVLSPVQWRTWGDEAGYVADPDGHILAFARTGTTTSS